MSVTDSLPKVAFRSGATLVVHRPGLAVVWLRGEHDVTTVGELTDAIAAAIALDDGDLVIDVSAVEFLDSTTLDVLTRTRDSLGNHSRSMAIRAPSPPLRRVLELRGVAALIDEVAGAATLDP